MLPFGGRQRACVPRGGGGVWRRGALPPTAKPKQGQGALGALPFGCRKSGLRHFFEVFIAPLRLRRGQGAMQRNPCYARLFADLPYTPPNPIITSGGCGPRTPGGFSTDWGRGPSGPPALRFARPPPPPRDAGAYPSPGSAARASRNSPSSRAMASAEGARLIRARSWAPPRMPRMYQAICLRIST